MKRLTAADIANFLKTEYTGKNRIVTGINGIEDASIQDLSFCMHEDPELVEETDAGVVISLPSVGQKCDTSLIESERPRLDFKRVVAEFFMETRNKTTVHPTAVIEDGAEIGEKCEIGSHVYLSEETTLGDRCTVLPGASIGHIGFAFEPDEKGQMYNHVHNGGVTIGDDVFIGANVVIDRSVFNNTKIGNGSKIHNLTHIAHNVIIGSDVWICNNASVAGGVTIGDRTRIHPQASIATRVVIGNDAEIGINSTVLDDVTAETQVVGSPAKPID
jgi:UDP-3-O-[3-hydroxymyristoyl] glucosamine N-acyltransferase